MISSALIDEVETSPLLQALQEKLPDLLNKTKKFIKALAVLLPLLDDFLQEHAETIFKSIPLIEGQPRHTLADLITQLPLISFAKVSRATYWAETSANLKIAFNPKFPAWIEK